MLPRLLTLALPTPLDLMAFLHLADAYMDNANDTYDCKSTCCVVTITKIMASTALAIIIVTLSLLDWHVQQHLPYASLQCRMVSAILMHALQMDCAYTALAFLLP